MIFGRKSNFAKKGKKETKSGVNRRFCLFILVDDQGLDAVGKVTESL